MKKPSHGGNLIWAAALAGCSPSELLDFSASINPLGPPQSAIAAITKGLTALNAYPDPNYSQLCSTLGNWHQLPPEWILPGNGSAELLTWACRELSQLDVTYLFTPAFGDYWRSLKAFHAQVKPILLSEKRSPPLPPLLRGGENASPNHCTSSGKTENSPQITHPLIDSDQIIPPLSRGNQITPPLIRGVFRGDQLQKSGILINNPHNPTGQVFTQETLKAYLEEFALVVVDEAFMDFLPPREEQSLLPLVTEYTNLVILRSLTKFYSLPGLRIGYAISHPDRLRNWQQWRDPWPVNVLAEQAAIAVIQDKEYQQQTWNWLPPTRKELFEGLQAIPGLQPLPGAANFLLVETAKPSSQLQTQLLTNHKILIRDCLSFPELGDRFFRVAVRSQPENKLLLQALTQCLLNTT